jgi:hypothetical protein
MSYEYEIEDVEYDTGYGVERGNIMVECEAIIEDGRFDAHNEAGNSQTYGGDYVGGVKVLDATLYLIGNNGVELGEVEFTQADLFKEYPSIEEDLIQRLSEETD